MPDKQKMPADGEGVQKGMPDGVSGKPGSPRGGQVNGRLAGALGLSLDAASDLKRVPSERGASAA